MTTPSGVETWGASQWADRGAEPYDREDYVEALAAYDRALALESQVVDFWIGKAEVLLDLERHQEARTAFEEAAKLKPDSARSWGGLGQSRQGPVHIGPSRPKAKASSISRSATSSG